MGRLPAQQALRLAAALPLVKAIAARPLDELSGDGIRRDAGVAHVSNVTGCQRSIILATPRSLRSRPQRISDQHIPVALIAVAARIRRAGEAGLAKICSIASLGASRQVSKYLSPNQSITIFYITRNRLIVAASNVSKLIVCGFTFH